ncbi:HIT family protein [Streptomyces roseifaciens]|uniref:HIT family protein n=1 Tax=Streptomyces roseifaciens TaxID=1488406 RepID=UPI0007180F4E|nr:HIT domain-containing protein [Streptomyces roseifaciens]
MSDFYCDEALSGRTPVRVVAETATVLAFEHTKPLCPVHIVPKQHVPSLIDLGDHGEKVIGEAMAVVREVAARVCEEHGAASVVTNVGSYENGFWLSFCGAATRSEGAR